MRYRVGDRLKVKLTCQCPGCKWLTKQEFVTVKRIDYEKHQYFFVGEHEDTWINEPALRDTKSELLRRAQNLDMFKRR